MKKFYHHKEGSFSTKETNPKGESSIHNRLGINSEDPDDRGEGVASLSSRSVDGGGKGRLSGY